MTTPPSPVSSYPANAFAPAPPSPVRPFYWSVRRELWEYRSIYLAPLIVSALFLVGFFITIVYLANRVSIGSSVSSLNPAIDSAFNVASGLIMAAAFLIALFYSLVALHGERTDRSILFWKSMPVSDLTTVLAKAAMPIFVIPMIAFVITFLTQWAMLLISSAVYLSRGLPAASPWKEVHFASTSVGLLFHLILIHGLWYSPFYAFLLFVSAWARRAPFLWAALPIVAIVVVENHVFKSTRFVDMLKDRIGGGNLGTPFTSGANSMNSTDSMATMMHLNPLPFFLSPGLWLGLLLTALFLYAATLLRRYRTPL